MEVVPVRSSSEWNKALASIPNAHVLQAWQWGELKSRYGWTPSRIVFVEMGEPRAAAQILRRHLPRTPFGVHYVPKGPALDYDDASLFEEVLRQLEQYVRRDRGIFLKVDPDIRVKTAAAAILPSRGWSVSAEQIQYHNTVTLDLTRSEDELLAGMKPKWRYNLRLAERRGVRVEAGNVQDLELFYDLYAETGARDHFLIRQFPYYREVWTTMLRSDLARLFFAKVDSETVAGLILFLFARRAWYFYGASRSGQRELMPNHLLQWEAIRRARAEGCSVYDFWGAPGTLDEKQPMFGVYKFKMGFGGEFVEHVPAHDFVVHPALYWLYAVVRPRYLARLRSRHSTQILAD